MKLDGPAIHPGEVLSDELAKLGVSASNLARAIGMPVNRITQILNGQWGLPPTQPCGLGSGSASAGKFG